jgi:flagellar M-ring protein FliF
VAVLINRSALTVSLGDKAGPEAVGAQVKEIEQLVASAAGLDKQRGDVVKVSVVDFVDSSRDLEPAPGPTILEILARQTGSIVNAGAVVLVAAMVVWFGMRPGLKMLLASAMAANGASTDATRALGAPDAGQNFLIESDDGRDAFLEALLARRDNGPERKLQKLVEFDENHAATILKQWIRQGANG